MSTRSPEGRNRPQKQCPAAVESEVTPELSINYFAQPGSDNFIMGNKHHQVRRMSRPRRCWVQDFLYYVTPERILVRLPLPIPPNGQPKPIFPLNGIFPALS